MYAANPEPNLEDISNYRGKEVKEKEKRIASDKIRDVPKLNDIIR